MHLELNTEQDSPYDIAPVPLEERRGPVTMGLLWITMVTAFPSMLIGFEWFKSGFTLPQVILGTILSCTMLLLYAIPATQLGAKSGLSYTALSRSIFGRWGSGLISINLILVFVGFYGLFALMLADSLKGLFHWQAPVTIVAACLAIAMSANNFFGFKGIANFARYIAAPLLIIWVLYTFCKAIGSCPNSVLSEPPHKSFAVALTTISSFVIGYAVWGNEPDYWRFGEPKTIYSAVPLTVSLLIGQIIFPITGWMMAKITGITDYGAATSLMNEYSFGGIALLSALVLTAAYFATNDSCLFGQIEAGENLIRLRHRTWVCIWAMAGVAMAVFLSLTGASKSMESITSLNGVILPTPTVIMMAEWFLLAYVFNTGSISDWRVPNFKELPVLRYPAIVALLAGITVGVVTSGFIPGTCSFNVGVCSVQAWLTSLIVYLPLRYWEYKQHLASQRAVLEKVLAKTPSDSGFKD